MKLDDCPICNKKMRVTENCGQKRVSHRCLDGITITTLHYPNYKKDECIKDWNLWAGHIMVTTGV